MAPCTPSKAITGSGELLAASSTSGLSGQASKDEDIGVVGALGARQAGETQLAVELPAVVVRSGDHERALALGLQVAGEPHRNFGIAREEIEKFIDVHVRR